MKRKLSKTMLAIAMLSLFILSGCSKYDDGPAFSLLTKTSRLVGEWEVIEVNGKTLEDNYTDGFLDNVSDPENYDISGTREQTFIIEKNGDYSTEIYHDFTFDYESESLSNYFDLAFDMEMNGEWEWKNDKEDIEITYKEITIDGETLDSDEMEDYGFDDEEEYEILRLTIDELWFEDEDGDEYHCEKY